MKDYVFCLLCFIVTLVASNPAAQRLPPQQRQYNNPVQYQAPASQTRPSNQNVKVQNQTPNLGNFDSTKLNDLLMTKILGNPSLQKIMDPNTKLYKQNGQEIHRQPNPGVPPSVVNNYFIVPPEFFTIKNNKTGSKPKNKARAQSNSTQKRTPKRIAEIKTKPKASKANAKSKNKDDVEIINQNGRSKKAKKKSAQAKSAKLVEENSKSKPENNDENLQTQPKKTKRRRKQNQSTKLESPPPNENKKVDIQKEEAVSSEIKTAPTKRRRKTKIKPETVETVTQNTTEAQDLPPNVEIINTPVIEKPVQQETVSKLAKLIEEPVNDTPLKRIEPVNDKKEISKDSQLARPSISIDKNLKSKAVESDKTQSVQAQRNSKGTTAVSGQNHKNSPVPDDYLKNYFPYMYMGNNFYPNSNYPFDFEQFYQPYLNNNNNSKNNRTKSSTRKNTNVKSKEPLPNALEVKLKQKIQNVTTTTEKPSTVMIEDFSSDTSAESEEQISYTHITKVDNFINRKQTEQKHESLEVTNMETNEHEFPLEKSNESSEETMQPEVTLPKQVTAASRSSLEMPPTVLEDLHDFNMPELGREDIMPTAHTNGIIADYYPIFNDDSYYANEEKFFLGELEDERHFYTTDRGFENLNRERRKFDKHEDYLNSNVDFVDRVNFRRAFKYRERDKPKHEYDNSAIKDTNEQLHTKEVHKIIVQSEKIIEKNETKPEIITEDQFQSPPLLENPDFQTRPIERLSPVFDPNIHYTNVAGEDSTEIEPEEPIQSYINTKPIKYNRLVFDTDFDDENKVSYIDNFKVPTTKKPTNDRIETVFAKSRVVRYGVANDEYDDSEHLPVRDNGADKFYGDGQTTYVLAKSLGKPEDHFW